jgi:hypothetical protein
MNLCSFSYVRFASAMNAMTKKDHTTATMSEAHPTMQTPAIAPPQGSKRKGARSGDAIGIVTNDEAPPPIGATPSSMDCQQ